MSIVTLEENTPKIPEVIQPNGGTGKNTLMQVKEVVDSINGLMSSFNKNPLIQQLINKKQSEQQSNLIQSDPGAKQFKQYQPEKKQLDDNEISFNDEQLMSFFSKPEGLLKIADAIENLIPIIGDIKLSELKNSLTEWADSEKQKQEEPEKNNEKESKNE